MTSIEGVRLTIERLQAQVVVPRNVIVSVDDAEGFLRNEIVVRLTRKIATIPGRQNLYLPDGPWQAWKEKYLDVSLRWMPVRYRTYEALGFLPDLLLPDSAGGIVARWREVTA